MAYRNGTYVAFHANGTDVPIDSDIKYYNLLKAWTAKSDDDFTMINSHDKASAVRDTSLHTTLRASLQERLRKSKNMLLIIGETTRFDTDWVPFEIQQAVDCYKIPIIAAYPDTGFVLPSSEIQRLWPGSPSASLSEKWPSVLADRINNKSARVIHVPFKKQPIARAIEEFNHNNFPDGSVTCYDVEDYKDWQLIT